MIKRILTAISLKWLADQQEVYLGLWRQCQRRMKGTILDAEDWSRSRALQQLAGKYLLVANTIQLLAEELNDGS